MRTRKADKIAISQRIESNKMRLKKLDLNFRRACCPVGPPSGTAYNDYDTRHGSRKEFRLEDYYEARKRLITFIALDEQILDSMYSYIDDKQYIDLLENNIQRVTYCRIIRGYTQERTAELIGISERQVRRIEQKI